MKVKKKTIVLDPGHGMGDDGKWRRPLMTLSRGKVKTINKFHSHKSDNKFGFYREDIGVLDIALAAEESLIAFGYDVYLTRRDYRNCAGYLANGNEANYKVNQWKKDNWETWRWAKMLSKTVKADAFVSVHTNAGEGKGLIGFYASMLGIPLIDSICDSIEEEFCELRSRKAKKHRYMVLRNHTRGNACLMECGFHDSPIDLEILLHKECRELIGYALARGIHQNLLTN